MTLRDNVERWLIHESLKFTEEKNIENSFHFKLDAAGFGILIEIFEPKSQQGILVVGSKVPMNNSQTVRYRRLNEKERQVFETKVADYCKSIRAVNRNAIENGKYTIGVYIVLDSSDSINQQGIFVAINDITTMHEKVSRFLLKTF